jgi:hypothetical protein
MDKIEEYNKAEEQIKLLEEKQNSILKLFKYSMIFESWMMYRDEIDFFLGDGFSKGYTHESYLLKSDEHLVLSYYDDYDYSRDKLYTDNLFDAVMFIKDQKISVRYIYVNNRTIKTDKSRAIFSFIRKNYDILINHPYKEKIEELLISGDVMLAKELIKSITNW